MDGKTAIPAKRAGAELYFHCRGVGTHTCNGKIVLLGNMPIGRDAGCVCVDRQMVSFPQEQEDEVCQQVFSLKTEDMVAPQRACSDGCDDLGRFQRRRYAFGSLQLIRKNSDGCFATYIYRY